MRISRWQTIGPLLFLLSMVAAEPRQAGAQDAVHTVRATFDTDPEWDAFRNRLLPSPPPRARQDFGWRATNLAGGAKPGEIGGIIQRSTTPAWYARQVEARTLDDRLSASGTLSVPRADGGSGVMVGWFHETSRGWRTPNSLGFRIDGNGGKFWAFYEYGTRGWLTGGGGAFEGELYQRTPTKPFATDGSVHRWSLDYDPNGAGGRGLIEFRIDDRRYELALAEGHRANGAMFNRFGIWNVQTPGDQLEFYVDDLVVDGHGQSFDQDPRWIAKGTPAEYIDRVRRPFHDFGYSATNHRGAATGEIGGIIFRDESPAYYAARLGRITATDELRATGTLVLEQAAADSGVYLGWFNSDSKQAHDQPEHIVRQKNYLAVLLEGPSRVGHYFRPSYAASDGRGATADADRTWPIVRPDGQRHAWALHYRPPAATESGEIELTFDGQTRKFAVDRNFRQSGATFDRFGLFNMQSGGHHVELYLDDLTYSAR